MGAAARFMARANGPALYFRSLSLWPPSRIVSRMAPGCLRITLRAFCLRPRPQGPAGLRFKRPDRFLVTFARAFNYFCGGLLRPYGPRPRPSGCSQRGPPPRWECARGAPAPSRVPRLPPFRAAAAPARWPGQGRVVSPRPSGLALTSQVSPFGPGAFFIFRLTRCPSGPAPASNGDFQNVLTMWGDPKRTTPPHIVEERFKNRIHVRCSYRPVFLWPSATPTHHPKKKVSADALTLFSLICGLAKNLKATTRKCLCIQVYP